MSFPIRQYPLLASIWNQPHTPSGGSADLTNIPSQLYIDPHWSQISSPYNPNGQPWIWFNLIFIPEGLWTPKRGSIIAPDQTVAEYYYVMFAEHYYKGFLQATFGITVTQANANGTIPRTY